MTEDEMVGWHHRLDGHEFEQAPGGGDGQGGLACCSPWGCKELDTTEQMNWTDFYLKSDISSDKLLIDENKLLKLHKFSPLKSVACLNGNNNRVKIFYIFHEIDYSLIKSDSFNIANLKKFKKKFFFQVLLPSYLSCLFL